MDATAREQRMPGRAPPPAVTARMRVALVHDWLTGMRGGEKVLDAICELFPEAPLYTLIRVPGSVSRRIENRRIVTSIAQALPRPDRFYRYYLPLYPLAIELFDLDHYDLIISSSHCAAKSVVRTGGSVHVCYCHSPMRYAWDQFDAYFGPDRIGPLGSRLLRPVLRRLARWDAATAGRVDRFLANSQYVAGRIDRYYNRRSTIVHPPVDTDFYTPVGRRAASSAFLIVSALVPYKRLDVAIDACRRVGRPLRIVGTGPELARLRARAGSGVEFLGWQSDEQIRALYRESAATLLPGVEDFGIVPVEAQACGCPAVALDAGGARDTIVDGVTGVLVPEPTAAAFAGGLDRALATPFDPEAIRANALRFSRSRFLREFRAAVEEALAESRHRPGAGPHDPPAGSSSQETGPSSPQAGRQPDDTPAGRPAPSQQAGRQPDEPAARWSPPSQQAAREPGDPAARRPAPSPQAGREPGDPAAGRPAPSQQAGREPGETAARWSPPPQQAARENKQ